MNEKKLKVYSRWSIILGTYLGGPLAATYFIANNFKALGDEESAKKTWQIGLIATVLLFTGLFLLPTEIADKQPNTLIPVLYTIIAAITFNKNQKDKVDEYVKNGNPKAGGWKTFGMSLMWLAITFGGALLVALVGEQIFSLFT
jgi:hypothetical protein